MIVPGKCPKCENFITGGVSMTSMKIGNSSSGPFLNGVAACCPHCQTILSIFPDPASLVADVVHEVKRALKKL
jgi:hypothetical protein